MKSVICLCVLIAAVAAIDVYPTKYDNFDVDSVLNNKRLLDNYVRCLLKQGKCTEEGAVLRDIIPDALLTGCSKCNERQQAAAKKVIAFLAHHRKDDFQKLVQLYDPNGDYRQKYGHYLQNL